MGNFSDFFKQYKWRIVCICFGILFAILIFTIGFWRTLLLFAIVGVCFVLGKALDEGGGGRISRAFSEIFTKK
jgi:uncharacterized membrane protein